MISVVIPTIRGREGLLAQTREAYRATTPDLQLITVHDHPTIGDAWNAGAEKATGDWLHLSADDVVPCRDWYVPCIETAEAGDYPCPVILRPGGSVESGGTLGGGMLLPDQPPDGSPCVASPFPFLARELYPGCLPIQYYADDWLGHCTRTIGQRAVVRTGYRLTHLEGTFGRARVAKLAMQHRDVFLQAVAKGAAICV